MLAGAACGDDASSNSGASSGGASSSGASGSSGGANSSSGASGGPTDGSPATELTGVWSVSGKDARGAYHGQAEVRLDGGKTTFLRSVQYDAVTVEDGRALNVTWVGEAKGDPKTSLTIDVTLDPRGFIPKRDAVEHKLTDATIKVSGTITLAKGAGSASYAGTNIDGVETWEKRTPNGATPIFTTSRTIVPGHDPPSAAIKTGFFSTYSSFQELPEVKPYASRPEFNAAIHGFIIDKTDFDFYRQNPNVLRVVNKPVDAISTQEALSRANAFRKTLAEKAAGFDAQIDTDFIDPTTGMLLDAAPDGQPKQVHISAALWTGVYMASQVYRFEATGDAKAKANALKTLDGILKLQEVTGDWKQFARAIRVAQGNPQPPWHAGAGALSGLEWLEGGNNDMMKGLYLAYLFGNRLVCTTTPNDPLCARIRTNAKHLSDDINVDRGSDELDSAWLTAVVTTDPLAKIQYKAKADAAWVASKPVISNNTTLYSQGTADWSGLNLGFVGHVFHMLLAEKYDVGGNGKSTYQGVIADSWGALKKQRLPLWNLLGTVYSGQPQDPALIDDVLWRLREMPFPKSIHRVDHRIHPEFCMSPYPSLPWKNDWTTTDRTQALRSVPLFEEALDIYRFRTEMRYAGSTDARPPAPEYLIAYWFGRAHQLIPASE